MAKKAAKTSKVTTKSSEGHNLQKLINLMFKVVPDDDGNIVFYDDGKNQILHVTSADSMAITAIMPSGGYTIEPVSIKRQEFLKPYRPSAKLSGEDGKLNMRLGHWRMTLAGSVENGPPSPVIVEGERIVASVESLKSVPTEDNYGGSTWAVFLPEGIAAFISNYSMTAIVIDDVKKIPSIPVMMQANAIHPLVNLIDGELSVGEYAVGIRGKFPVGNGVDADIYIALSKPDIPPPSPEAVLSMMPTKTPKLTVGAADLRQCIEGAKKTFDEDATELTFVIDKAGITISLQSSKAALQETVPFIKAPEKSKGRLKINTDILVNAFKGLRELTSGKAIAGLRWDEKTIWIKITEMGNSKMLGAVVVSADQD